MDASRFQPYLHDLIAGRREACRRHVAALLAEGASPRELYIELFGASLYEVGARWERGEVSVAIEHIATSITEELLALTFPHAARREPVGRKAVVSCSANEFHQIGGRIVADSLEAAGWDVLFVGSGVPDGDLASLVAREAPDLVALSVSVRANLPRLVASARAVRVACPRVPIILGGQGLNGNGAAFVRDLALSGVAYVDSLEALDALAASLVALR